MAKKAVKVTKAVAPESAEEKKKALETALSQIKKDCGEEAIRRLGDSADLQILYNELDMHIDEVATYESIISLCKKKNVSMIKMIKLLMIYILLYLMIFYN